MPEQKIDRFEALNAYQVAGLAIAVSAAAALAVLFVMRRMVFRRSTADSESTVRPITGGQEGVGMPAHFSENLIVPGFTETGQEISEQDATQGGSPEGV